MASFFDKESILNKKILLDVFLNYFSLLLGGVSGLLISVLVAHSFGPKGLGNFQLVYAVYIVLSQFSVFGIHQSILRYIPSNERNKPIVSKIFWSALFLSVFVSTFFCAAAYLSSSLIGRFTDFQDLKNGISQVSLALIFFSFNKIILLYFNALKKMRIMAFFQSLRFLMMIAFVFFISKIYNDFLLLPLCFVFTEFLLFIGMLPVIIKVTSFSQESLDFFWMRKHFIFGLKSMANGILMEFNAKVDILILGVYADPYIVGIYSFSSTLMECILGLFTVIKNQISPYLVVFFSEKEYEKILKIIKKSGSFLFIFSVLVTIFSYFLYDLSISILHLEEFAESKKFFLILCLGLCVYSIFSSFDNIFILSGHPEKQSYFALFTILSNISLNFLLVPFLKAYGTALATSSSFFLSAIYLYVSVKSYKKKLYATS